VKTEFLISGIDMFTSYKT